MYASGRIGTIYWLQRGGAEHRQGVEIVDPDVYCHGCGSDACNLFPTDQFVVASEIRVLIEDIDRFIDTTGDFLKQG